MRSMTSIKEDTAKLTSEGCSFTSGSCNKIRKVAIIGAGPAGLCAARHFFAPGSGFTGCLYEQAGDLGGTWLYSDVTGKDRFGLPVHSTLYYDLWTNLPKETMTYPDFEYQDEERSYLPSSRVLQYLVDYADYFNLHNYIKLHHHVTRVAPVGNSWSVSAMELTTKVEHVSMFDAVIVCSGPNIIPVYPQVEGLARFSGRQLHSKEYRKASAFEGKRVLLIGLGPSGIDICFCLMPVAKQVIISHNLTSLQGIFLPSEIKLKPVATLMQEKTVTFSDGSEEEVDVIIHCTGYTYHYPFLTPECGLIVDQYVTPLYRHFINIEHPTMCLVGIPRKCPHQYMLDFQVRTFMKILNADISLPSKETMLAEMEEDRAKRAKEGQRKKDFHKMNAQRNEEYFKQLAELGNLKPIPPVILKIFNDAFMAAIKEFVHFRKAVYKILDNENYTKDFILTSEASDKLNIDTLKVYQEVDLNRKDMEEFNNKEGKTHLTVTNSEKPSAKESKEEEEEVIIERKVTEIEGGTMDTTVTNTPKEEVLEETLTEIEKFGSIKVEAVVEVKRPELDFNTEKESNGNNDTLKIAVNGGRVSIDLQENITKPICGDEIVKIIQTEEESAYR
ncbi:senecionine N-oxygenase-like isoform X2 [Rhodnius prolixus]|uniref:senecionine N-oxygenase-like isoform X2 n=1 Tax=Rhodnius prolixus TaxID=13249 RepID=UPI003D189E62